jgi:hypothetical protein
MEWVLTEFGWITGFIELFDAASDYSSQNTVTHINILSHSVHQSSDNGFQLRMFFLWVPELSPLLSPSNSRLNHQPNFNYYNC